MTLLSELLGSAEGQLSLVVLVFMIGMGVFFARMFFKNMKEDAAKNKK
jgi:uncharacterized protein DUF3149